MCFLLNNIGWVHIASKHIVLYTDDRLHKHYDALGFYAAMDRFDTAGLRDLGPRIYWSVCRAVISSLLFYVLLCFSICPMNELEL